MILNHKKKEVGEALVTLSEPVKRVKSACCTLEVPKYSSDITMQKYQ